MSTEQIIQELERQIKDYEFLLATLRNNPEQFNGYHYEREYGFYIGLQTALKLLKG